MTDPVFNPESLDLSNLREITGGDKELEQTLFQTFITCGEESLNVLGKIIADGEQTEWKEHSHSLKGEAANLGANKLAAICHDSQMAYGASRDEKAKLLANIKTEWQIVTGYLDQLLKASA